jgi:sigma-B regulation protein RsbU (phosphoserine phosphatase)
MSVRDAQVLPGKLDSLDQVRAFVKSAAAQVGLDKKYTYRLVLAVDEIVTNIVLHGYEESGVLGDLTISADISERDLAIIIEDSAPRYDPIALAEPGELERPLEEREIGGLGVFLANRNVDEFHYDRVNDRNRHTFIVHFSALASDSRNDQKTMLSNNEKTEILKNVRLFSRTEEPILASIAAVLEETEVEAGERIVTKGEPGDSMYFIESGWVYVHDGERTLDYLGKYGVFGETAPIDPMIRTASVTAMEKTRLLRLDHKPLRALIEKQPGVAQEMIQLLTIRLRARMQELDDLRYHLEGFILPLGMTLSQEESSDRLLERVLVEAQAFCRADAATVYLMTDDRQLQFHCMRTDSLGIQLGGTTGKAIPHSPLPLYDAETGEPNEKNVATYVALRGHTAHIPNIYDTAEFDFSATREFDRKNGYRSVSSLTVPLKNHRSEVVGVLQLFNAQDPESGSITPFDTYQQMVVESLAAQAAAALNTRTLLEKQKGLLKYENDIQTAARIQADFLPDSLPDPPGWDIDAICQPARDVAGDFYDAFTLSQGRRVCFVIGDVVDKGVPAALFMALVRSLTRAFAQQHYSINWTEMLSDKEATSGMRRRGRSRAMTGTIALKNAVTLTNQYILDNHMDLTMFATLFIGMVDPRDGQLAYINAGHNPPYLISAGGQLKETLRPTGPAVGMLQGIDFEIAFTHFEPGDVLFAYTDGVTEARSISRDFYTDERLLEVLQQPNRSAHEVIDRAERAVLDFIGDADRFDDITMIAVQREPGDQK